MKKLVTLLLLLASIISCSAETFILDYSERYKLVDGNFISTKDKYAYRVIINVINNSINISVTEVRISATGTVTTVRQIQKTSFNSTDENMSIEGREKVDGYFVVFGDVKLMTSTCMLGINDDIYSALSIERGELERGESIYDVINIETWKTLTSSYHKEQYDKLVAALKQLKWKNSDAPTSSATANNPKQKTEEYTKLANLFIHPLGLPEDIREITPLKFESFIKQQGYSYEKSIYKPYYIFRISEKHLTNIAGIGLPLEIWFSEESVSVYYEPREVLIYQAFEYAEQIASAFRNAGFETASSDGLQSTYEGFLFDGDVICIRMVTSYDLTAVGLLKK